MIPEWIVTIFKEYMLKRLSGSVVINFSDGSVRNVHIEKEVKHPPK